MNRNALPILGAERPSVQWNCEPGWSPGITGTLNMSIAVNFPAGGAVFIACSDQGGTMNWWYLRITAIKGGSVRSTPLQK